MVKSRLQTALFFLFNGNFHPLPPSPTYYDLPAYLILPNVPTPRLLGHALPGCSGPKSNPISIKTFKSYDDQVTPQK